MKKADFILLFAVLFLAGAMLLGTKLTKTEGDTVIITKDGEVFGEYPLSSQMEVPVGESNTVKIQDGTAYMHSATCPDKLCIRQGKVADSSKKIVCLPNRVTVEVTKKSEIDEVVR